MYVTPEFGAVLSQTSLLRAVFTDLLHVFFGLPTCLESLAITKQILHGDIIWLSSKSLAEERHCLYFISIATGTWSVRHHRHIVITFRHWYWIHGLLSLRRPCGRTRFWISLYPGIKSALFLPSSVTTLSNLIVSHQLHFLCCSEVF